jgi:hypothetical protein
MPAEGQHAAVESRGARDERTECLPSLDEAEQVSRHAVGVADLVVLIHQQREGQVVGIRERGVRLSGVAADAQDDGTGSHEVGVSVPERAGLLGAAGRRVGGVEEEDHVLAGVQRERAQALLAKRRQLDSLATLMEEIGQ